MAELKTKETDASVKKFLDSVPDETKRKDSYTLLEMMGKATGDRPKLWGTSIVGFGKRTYSYASGRTGEWFDIGFSPRKQELTLYVWSYGLGEGSRLLGKLGKHSTGKGCLYIKRLSDVDMPTLEKLIKESVEQARRPQPPATSQYATSEAKKKRDAKTKAKQTQKSGAKAKPGAKGAKKTTAKKNK